MQYVGSFIYMRCPIKQKRTPDMECVCDIDCFVFEKLGGAMCRFVVRYNLFATYLMAL